MNFNELPIEIIQMIFYIHVHQHIGSKRTLLRTCRTWHNVASNYAILWRAIHWHSRNSSTTVHPDDHCLNFNDLAQDIGRTGTMTFDLVIEFPAGTPSNIDQRRFTVEVDPNWLSRCRSLSLYQSHVFPNSVQSMLNAILSAMDRDFPSLEHLSISEMGTDLWDGAFDTLISRVAESSINLQSLELSSRWDLRGIEGRVFHFPDILHRIRRLQLTSIACLPSTEFPNLEHLDYTVSIPNRQSISNLVAPRLTSLCLGADFINLDLPHALFDQLTHLVLRNFYAIQAAHGIASPSSFSRLLSLGIQTGNPGKWLQYINTRNPLEELILANDCKMAAAQDFSNTTFQPRILRVDMLPADPSHCGFGTQTPLWGHVEEVHVTVREDTIWSWFIRALSKPADDQHGSREYCPLLRILTVLYPDNDQDSEQKQKQIEELRDIQRGRKESGFRLLETLKIGWYRPCNRILTVPYPERQVMQWRDCLEDWTP